MSVGKPFSLLRDEKEKRISHVPGGFFAGMLSDSRVELMKNPSTMTRTRTRKRAGRTVSVSQLSRTCRRQGRLMIIDKKTPSSSSEEIVTRAPLSLIAPRSAVGGN